MTKMTRKVNFVKNRMYQVRTNDGDHFKWCDNYWEARQYAKYIGGYVA